MNIMTRRSINSKQPPTVVSVWMFSNKLSCQYRADVGNRTSKEMTYILVG